MLGIHNVSICSRDCEGDRIEDDLMKQNNTAIIQNEGINRLIYYIYVSMHENAFMDEFYQYIHDVPLIGKAQKPLLKDSKTSFSLLFCCWST